VVWHGTGHLDEPAKNNYELWMAVQEIGDALQIIPQHRGKAKPCNNLHP
jgi:hypothetical protein